MSNVLKPIWWGALLCLLALSLSAFANGDEQPEGDLEEFSTTICCFGLKEFTPSQSVIDDLTKLSARINEIEISNIRSISVVGHTDSSGVEGYDNSSLSKDRALAVKDYLVDMGLDAQIISIEAAGSSQPRNAANDNNVDCAEPMLRCVLNRRADISLYYRPHAKHNRAEIEGRQSKISVTETDEIAKIQDGNNAYDALSIRKFLDYFGLGFNLLALILSVVMILFTIFIILGSRELERIEAGKKPGEFSNNSQQIIPLSENFKLFIMALIASLAVLVRNILVAAIGIIVLAFIAYFATDNPIKSAFAINLIASIIPAILLLLFPLPNVTSFHITAVENLSDLLGSKYSAKIYIAFFFPLLLLGNGFLHITLFSISVWSINSITEFSVFPMLLSVGDHFGYFIANGFNNMIYGIPELLSIGDKYYVEPNNVIQIVLSVLFSLTILRGLIESFQISASILSEAFKETAPLPQSKVRKNSQYRLVHTMKFRPSLNAPLEINIRSLPMGQDLQ